MSRLYIIHGWAYSIAPWQTTVELLKKSGIDVVQLRVPGLTAPSDRAWTIDDYMSWLDNELRDDTAPIVLGHSNGGRILLHYLKAHPDRLKHIILLSSAGLEMTPTQLSIKRRVFMVASKVLAPLKYIPFAKRIVYRLTGGDYNAAPPHMKRTLQNMLASDHGFDVSAIATPTTILWGEDDAATPLAMARELHRQLRNSTLETFPDWQHAPYRTHPKELADAISKTWSKVA